MDEPGPRRREEAVNSEEGPAPDHRFVGRAFSLRTRLRSAVRSWWPVLGFIAIALAAQSAFTGTVVANGQHAADHLQSATAPFAIAFLLAVIMWAAPRARPHFDVWIAAAFASGAACVVLLGNLRVINAIAGDAWTDTQANLLGPARPGFDSGHSLAELGERATLAAVIVLTAVLLMRGVVRRGPAIAALAVSLVIPAHLIPGAGIFVLAGDVFIQRARRVKDPAKTAESESTTSMSSS